MASMQEILSLARYQEWGKLSALGEPAVKTLLEILHQNEIQYGKIPQNDIKATTTALGKIGKPYVSLIIEVYTALTKNNWSEAVCLAEALGEIDDKCAVEPLCQSLEWFGSYTAINFALASLGDERAFEPLIQSLGRGNSNSARALGMMKCQTAVEPLIQALSDPQSNVRFAAAAVLGDLEDLRAVEPLIHMLEVDSEMYGCANAALALGKLGDSRAVEPLKNAQRTRTFFSEDDLYEGITSNPAIKAYQEALEKLT